VGTGDSNYTGLFKELRKAKWDGVLAIETDNGTFARNPTDFVVAAIEYVKKNN
jgi:sugar phosphate isomerase/epimerase